MKKIFQISKFNLNRLLLLLFLFSASYSNSQDVFMFSDHWGMGLNLGYTNFYGDLSNPKNRFFNNTPFSKYFYKDRGFIYGCHFHKLINPYFGLRANLTYGKLKSTNEVFGMYIRADILEYNLMAKLDFSNMIFGYDKNRYFSIYGLAGLGLANWNTLRYSLKDDKVLDGNGFFRNGKGGKRLTTTEAVVPLGLGIAYKPNDNWSFFLENSIHIINTDKLDAFVNDASRYEGYGYASLGFTYNFGIQEWHLNFSNPRFDNRSNEPALKQYGKQRKIVMKTSQYNKAVKKRYKTTGRKPGGINRIFHKRHPFAK